MRELRSLNRATETELRRNLSRRGAGWLDLGADFMCFRWWKADLGGDLALALRISDCAWYGGAGSWLRRVTAQKPKAGR